MYVIFPAEELVEFTLSRNANHIYTNSQIEKEASQQGSQPSVKIQQGNGAILKPTKQQKKQDKEDKKNRKNELDKMAAAGGSDVTLRDLAHPSLNETLKNHNQVTFKLVRTVSDFTQQLSQIYEQHAEELQMLVSNFRKRNSELRKERPNCPSSLFHTWETLLQEVEIDSQAHSDIASILGRQVSRPLLERSFHRKIQSRKVFTYRENFEAMLNKAEDKLSKCRQDYKSAYLSYISSPSSAAMASYLDNHNAYVQQLSLTNAMLDQYHQETLPQLLQELEEIYCDLCSTLSEAVLQGAEIVSARAVEQSRRYDSLSGQCKAVMSPTDLAHFVRSVTIPHTFPHRPALRHNFVHPQPPPPPENTDGAPEASATESMNGPPPPSLKNEIIIDRLTSLPVRSRYDSLKKEAVELETQIKQLHDALDTLLRIQQRSLESNLYNKANELQEDISMKRFDLRATQIRLMGVQAQKELFASKAESASDTGRERKMSSSSTGSMKNKWLKAFKSLKTSSTPNGAQGNKEPDKKNQMYHAVSTIMALRKNGSGKGDSSQGNIEVIAHTFQEYTYKKITPCDVCSQVLRGHTRQGLKCRVCKLNVHLDCQEKAPRCQHKSRLLRRQKSTSEIDTRLQELTVPEDETPHSPRRQKLNLRMKSLSLDSPESTEHVQRRRHAANQGPGEQHSSQSSSSRIQSPSSPVHNRRLLSARNMRMSSVELPDDNEKSLSSASTSPCPSPKPHRLLPTNLYVVLFNFKSRHPDELDLKAGYKVTVIDTSDVDWWKGKCLGRIGYFPSKYVIKLQPGERPLQVTHNLQVSDGDNGIMLLRDQIVIQVGEDLDGMVMIRNGENRQGVCPLKFLQEV